MSKASLLKQWPWSMAVNFMASLLYVFAWCVITFYLWQQFQGGAVFSLFLLLPLAVYLFKCRKINKMINVLKGCISAQNGETEESYVCLHGKCSPGITIMRDNLFILIPVNGRRTKVFFEKISGIREKKSVPLMYLSGKRAFDVELEDKKSVSFMVKESVAKRWSVLLAECLNN